MTKSHVLLIVCVCVTTFPSGLCTTAINALEPPQQSPAQSTTQEQAITQHELVFE